MIQYSHFCMCSPTFCVPNLFPREAARSQPDSAKLSEIERACASGFRMTRRHAVHAAMPFLPVFAYHSCQYSPILASQLSPREMPPKSLHNRVKAPRHRARMCLMRSNAPFCLHCPYFICQISPQETRPKSRPNSGKAPSNRAPGPQAQQCLFLPVFAYTSYAQYLLKRCCPKVGRIVPRLPVIEHGTPCTQ